LLVVFAAFCGVARAARACDRQDEGRAAFVSGKEAFEAGRFRDAAARFELAYALACRTPALFNAAMAWDAAAEPARAASAFAAALRAGLPEASRHEAREHLDALRAEIGVLEIRGIERATVTVAHVRDHANDAPFYLPPGAHDLLVQLPWGESKRQKITIFAGKTTVVELPERPIEPSEPKREGPGPAFLGTSIASFSLGGVAGVAAIALGARALAARDAYVAGGRSDDELYEEADSSRLAANVCWAGAAALTLTGAVVLIVPFVTSEGAPRSVAVSFGGTSADLTVGF
jgi:hypothetical protein